MCFGYLPSPGHPERPASEVGLPRACLKAVGKMPVRRDVLIMCVSSGKSVGEIAWRKCEGIGSRGHVVG